MQGIRKLSAAFLIIASFFTLVSKNAFAAGDPSAATWMNESFSTQSSECEHWFGTGYAPPNCGTAWLDNNEQITYTLAVARPHLYNFTLTVWLYVPDVWYTGSSLLFRYYHDETAQWKDLWLTQDDIGYWHGETESFPTGHYSKIRIKWFRGSSSHTTIGLTKINYSTRNITYGNYINSGGFSQLGSSTGCNGWYPLASGTVEIPETSCGPALFNPFASARKDPVSEPGGDWDLRPGGIVGNIIYRSSGDQSTWRASIKSAGNWYSCDMPNPVVYCEIDPPGDTQWYSINKYQIKSLSGSSGGLDDVTSWAETWAPISE